MCCQLGTAVSWRTPNRRMAENIPPVSAVKDCTDFVLAALLLTESLPYLLSLPLQKHWCERLAHTSARETMNTNIVEDVLSSRNHSPIICVATLTMVGAQNCRRRPFNKLQNAGI